MRSLMLAALVALQGCAGYDALQWRKPEAPNKDDYIEVCDKSYGGERCGLVKREDVGL